MLSDKVGCFSGSNSSTLIMLGMRLPFGKSWITLQTWQACKSFPPSPCFAHQHPDNYDASSASPALQLRPGGKLT
jgi:hypothetical protein